MKIGHEREEATIKGRKIDVGDITSSRRHIGPHVIVSFSWCVCVFFQRIPVFNDLCILKEF